MGDKNNPKKKPRHKHPFDPSIAKTKMRIALAIHVVNKLAGWSVTAPVCIVVGLYMLKGEVTLADISIRLPTSAIRILNIDLNWWLVIITIVTIISAWYAVINAKKETETYRDKIEKLAARNQELESRQDPERSSSNITPRGETHPRDL